MAEDMNTLVIFRGRLKSSITRALGFADVPPDDCTFETVVSRLERLEEVWKGFVQSTDELHQYKNEEHFVDPEADFDTYEDKYLTARGKMYALKNRYAPKPADSPNNTGALEKLADQQAAFLEKFSTTTPPKEDTLPRINIPCFCGSYKEWTSFKNLFESTVDSKASLSNTQKFHYLKSLLKDDAARLIQHVPVTESAYTSAWIRLNDRYDRPKHIVNSFIESFFALPAASTENCSVLRKISDEANEIIRGLEAIGKDERDCWLIFLLLTKVDPESKSRWIHGSRDNPNPTISDFFDFLDNRCEELEFCHRKSTSQTKQGHSTRTHGNQTKCLVSTNAKSNTCHKCKSSDHSIFKCPIFLQSSLTERRDFVKGASLCYNCLRPGHAVLNCQSKNRCKDCRRRHNSLLHVPATSPAAMPTAAAPAAMPAAAAPTTDFSTSVFPSTSATPWSTVANVACPVALPTFSSGSNPIRRRNQNEFIMPTASILVKNRLGQLVTCRALLDSASKLSYITESCAQRLGLARSPSKVLVSGISSVEAETTRGSCQILVKSRISEDSFDAKVHVLSNITSPLPNHTFENKSVHCLKDLPLADPDYNVCSPIDILFGLQHIWNILTFNRRLDAKGNTIAVSTIFGWVVTCVETLQVSSRIMSLVATVDIDRCLRSFWEIEEPAFQGKVDPDDAYVESHFKSTHSRAADGKYVVQLPFKIEDPRFGNTQNGAVSRFYAVERRLQRNAALREQYTIFMREYEQLGHMRQINPNAVKVTDGRVFYLPHHPVLGEKIRVVFDGSFQDSNGISLNNTLHIGPSIQRDLFSVSLRFRFHRYVFSADIVKMFRQIWISGNHINYQRIVWRESPLEELKHYQLCTVTYGTACAPYLSVRVLEQLAHDHKSTYPIASQVLLKDFYVDDVLTGAATEKEIVLKRDSLVKLLSHAGLELRKWVSNCSRISVSTQDHSFLKSPDEDVKKVLGVYWKPSEDKLGYKIGLKPNPVSTKRQVLSDVSRIFDPMGLVAPVVVRFKILLRELWSHNLSWDEPLPENLAVWWTQCRNDLLALENFEMPRFVLNDTSKLGLHGFSDASIQAYAAAVYSRFVDDSGVSHVTLIASKTRVAPIKQKSLPRLELCGALLLSRLLKRIKEALPHKSITVRAWCDSTIVLSCLSQPPIKLKTFEANRTSEILENLPRIFWDHIASKENPADCASRGMPVSTLLSFGLWWKGPIWLSDTLKFNCIVNRSNNFDIITDPEALSAMKTTISSMVITVEDYNPLDVIVNRVSKWTKMVRIVAYMLKFFDATRQHNVVRASGLYFNELHRAKLIMLKHAQNAFNDDRVHLQNGRPISARSQLAKLNPFLDNNGLLRVGGRLRNSELDAATKNPIILPKSSRITQTVLEDLHERNLHPGVSALFVIARQTYWIIGARNLIRTLTHKCLRCFRQRQLNTHQLMADLPSIRVRQAFPFENTGCDYAGPLSLKQFSGRNTRKSKGYICIFVCLVTSAIHLELATDLSTDCFIAALRRFISRRGKCRQMYSDNGRNFLGASRELSEMHKVIMSKAHNEIVSASLAEDGIQWNFIPPFAPHWGGIWESGVRSVKLHLKRVIMNTELTFEQMHTLLAQIEAVVNSRPLGIAPDTECGYLSPAHFLIGRPYTMVPEGDLVELNPNRLGYWQHVQNMLQGFWRRWHQEYLTSLQQRPKWNQPQPNLAVGNIVVIKEKNLPPAKWLMAKVIETYPGPDGNIRVVKLKTQHGKMTRPITVLIQLPIF